jgi:ATP-dependent DNA helicase
VKKVNNMHLQNVVMQLRKVCSHPFLFDWPLDEWTNQPVVDEQLVDASGKMMVLERLLDELFARGHKVLVFSQFVTMLDVIEVRLFTPSRPRFCAVYSCMMMPLQDWAHEFKHWPLCRIDGSTGPLERRAEMDRFQKGGNGPDAPRLFLLSTRAGGLGINLTAADTVVFYDQDWVRTFCFSSWKKRI